MPPGSDGRQERADQAVELEQRHDVETEVLRREGESEGNVVGRSAHVAMAERHGRGASSRSRGVQYQRRIVGLRQTFSSGSGARLALQDEQAGSGAVEL